MRIKCDCENEIEAKIVIKPVNNIRIKTYALPETNKWHIEDRGSQIYFTCNKCKTTYVAIPQ